MENEYIWIRLGFIKSESFDHELPLKYWLKFTQDLMHFLNLYIYASQFCINFCFAKWKGMASKTPEEAIVMARNSSQIQEKIQIHFEINFDKCHFILKYICSTWSRHYWDFDIIMTNTWSALNELSLQCWCNAKFCFFYTIWLEWFIDWLTFSLSGP